MDTVDLLVNIIANGCQVTIVVVELLEGVGVNELYLTSHYQLPQGLLSSSHLKRIHLIKRGVHYNYLIKKSGTGGAIQDGQERDGVQDEIEKAVEER